MEFSTAFKITPSDEEKPGAYAVFPYDRELVRRFRDAFPRARWRGEESGWFVPGTTAVRRLDGWMAQELAALDRHADAKGRDAYSFDPLESRYLTVDDELVVRTPYSRTVVEALRSIPFARWDPEARVWRVPFRSYESLQALWPEIEAAARRNEPQEKRRRRAQQDGADGERLNRLQAERRRRRYPVPGDDLPPLGCPLSTLQWGVVVFEEIDAAPAIEAGISELYPQVRQEPFRFVWARWRMPGLQEVYRTRPARDDEDPDLRTNRGWWHPTREELRERARRLREIERAQQTRGSGPKTPIDA
jgi:hypothetical protein